MKKPITHTLVIPAQAGIQFVHDAQRPCQRALRETAAGFPPSRE